MDNKGGAFFFQAEDGIRDLTVTGVQTCALPICDDGKGGHTGGAPLDKVADFNAAIQTVTAGRNDMRSEERRVGKECRSRRSPEHKKKKTQTSKENNQTYEVNDNRNSIAER